MDYTKTVIEATLASAKVRPLDVGLEQAVYDLVVERDALRETLATIAAQHSGEVGSTRRADCMAAFARAGLKQRVVFDRATGAVTPLAQPAEPVALTDERLMDEFCITPGIHQFVQAFKAGARFAERAHGIGAARTGGGNV